MMDSMVQILKKLKNGIPQELAGIAFMHTATTLDKDILPIETSITLSVPPFIAKSIIRASVLSTGNNNSELIFDTLASHFMIIGFMQMYTEWKNSGRYDELKEKYKGGKHGKAGSNQE